MLLILFSKCQMISFLLLPNTLHYKMVPNDYNNTLGAHPDCVVLSLNPYRMDLDVESGNKDSHVRMNMNFVENISHNLSLCSFCCEIPSQRACFLQRDCFEQSYCSGTLNKKHQSSHNIYQSSYDNWKQHQRCCGDAFQEQHQRSPEI